MSIPAAKLRRIIRNSKALADLLKIKPTGTIKTKTIDLTDDIAVLHSPWTQVGTDEEGNKVSFSGITAEVVRQQSDGTWKYVIDDPWGGSDR